MDKNNNNDYAAAPTSSRRRFLRNVRDGGAIAVTAGLIGAPLANYALTASPKKPDNNTSHDGLTNVAYNAAEDGKTLVDAAQICPPTATSPNISINVPAVATAFVAGAVVSAAAIDTPTRRNIIGWTKKLGRKETKSEQERN